METDPRIAATLVMVGALMIFQMVLSCISFFRHKPPLHEKYATKQELDKLARKIEGWEALQRENNVKIYESIRDLEKSVTCLATKSDHYKQTLATLSGNINSLLQKIK